MDEEIITFDDIETEKHKFHRYKSFIFAEDWDIDNILVFNKISSGEKNHKFFIGYLHDDFEINSLNIMLAKTSAYIKNMIVKINGCFFFFYWRWWLIGKI